MIKNKADSEDRRSCRIVCGPLMHRVVSMRSVSQRSDGRRDHRSAARRETGAHVCTRGCCQCQLAQGLAKAGKPQSEPSPGDQRFFGAKYTSLHDHVARAGQLSAVSAILQDFGFCLGFHLDLPVPVEVFLVFFCCHLKRKVACTCLRPRRPLHPSFVPSAAFQHLLRL